MCHEFTIIEHNEPLQKRSLKRLMVVLLMIEGNCLTFRSKPAHLVGHLPLIGSVIIVFGTLLLLCWQGEEMRHG